MRRRGSTRSGGISSGCDERRGGPGRPAPGRTSTRRPPSRCTRLRGRRSLAALDQGYADPRRLHGAARSARLLLDNARAVVAECLGVRPDEVTFTVVRHRRRPPRPARACEAGPVAARRSSTPRSSTPRCSTPPPGPARARRASPSTAWAGSTADGRRGAAARRRPSWPSSRPTTRSAPSSRSARSPPPCPTAYPSSSTPAPRWAGCRCPRAGRPSPARRTSGAARPAWASCVVRKGVRWENPFPGDDRVDERTTGFENVPAALAAAAALQAVVAERDEVNARQHALVDRIRAAVAGDPRRRGGRRPGRPAPPPGHVLLPVRRRGGAGDRARPPRLRGRQRVGVHRLDARAEPRAGGDGRAHPRQRPRLADPRHHRGSRSTRSWPCCPSVVAGHPGGAGR